MLDPLVEPKQSAPTLYASDLAPCQIVSLGIEYCGFIIMDLGYLLFALFIICWSISDCWWSCIQSSKQYVHTCVCVCLSVSVPVYLPVKVNTGMSLKQSTFYEMENSTPLVELDRTYDRSITYRVPIIVIMSQIIKAIYLKYISIYHRLQTKKWYTKMAKNMNWRYPMTAILNFTIYGKTVSFGQKWIQHKNFI